jgi:hypothetical protein
MPLRHWWEAMALEGIPHCLVAEGVAQVLPGAYNAIIAPGASLTGTIQETAFHGVKALPVQELFEMAASRFPFLGAFDAIYQHQSMEGSFCVYC